MAFEVARSSIWRRTRSSLTIYPLRLQHLGGILTRPIERRDGKLWCPISQAHMSTEFAISRFCVPFLQESGLALFADCDVVCWSDIDELFALADPKYAVMVVRHEHPASEAGRPATKMDGQAQTYYSRKNWSSVVLWNLDHPANQRFTVRDLNTWPGRDLHAFKWLDDHEIGRLPAHWNHLIGVTPGSPEKKGVWHYTLGGPWFSSWPGGPNDDAWLNELRLTQFFRPAGHVNAATFAELA